MRAGILIIGSLLWDNGDQERWRRERLNMDPRSWARVLAPIRYGRLSKGGRRRNTYTMIFDAAAQSTSHHAHSCPLYSQSPPQAPEGRAVLVPCKARIDTVEALVDEAAALWKAETLKDECDSISGEWGCVGALFRDVDRCAELVRSWATKFRERDRATPPVDDGGVLHIPWPVAVNGGEGCGFDLLLATATQAEARAPKPNEIADAWLKMGHEDYFFKNVLNGIRTPDDLAIWKAIEHGTPHWLGKADYLQAIKTLRDEASASTC